MQGQVVSFAAAAHYEKSLSVAYDDPQGTRRKALVEIYLEIGKLYKAVEILEQRLQLSPFDAAARLERAKLYAAAEEFSRAIGECRKGLEVAAEDHELIAELGHNYARIGKDQFATAEWRRALELRPNFVKLSRYIEYIEGKSGYEERFAENIDEVLAAGRNVKAAGNEPAVVVLMKTIDRVHPDGTSSRAVHHVFKVMNNRGVQSLSGRSIPYLAGEQRPKVKTARVHRADGRVDEADISLGRESPETDVPRWSFARVSMPPLQVGDCVELEYKVDDIKQGFFGDYFGSVASLRLSVPIVRCKYILIVPKRRPVYYHLAGGAPEPKKTVDEELDATVYTWEVADAPKIESEPLMPNSRELAPMVYVSTYRDWKDFGSWYWDLIKKQHKMNQEMKDKVAALTRGLKTDFERIRAVYNFVVSDIRYVPWEFGVHGFNPYRASQIFDRKIGDCKDKATLINTMLGHLGIQAHPVLIRAEVPRSKQDMKLPMIQHFNHCISYVPAGRDYPEMFLDGTAIYHDIRTVPFMDEGAQVCVVKPGGAEIKTVPASDSKHNSSVEKTKIELTGAGAASAAVEAKWSGSRSPVIRQHFSVPDRRKLLLERLYGRHYAGTRCDPNLEFSNLTDLNEPVTFKYRLTVPRLMTKSGKNWKLKPLKGMLRGMLGSLYPNKLSELAAAAKREHHLLLVQRWSFETVQTYVLPQGARLVSKPDDCNISTKFGRLSIAYGFEGRNLTVKKLLSIKAVRITPEEYPEFRRFCNEVDEAEFREIILAPAE